MDDQLSLKAAIDKATEVCKTQRKLAAALGIHEATLAAVKVGKRGLTAEQIVTLAELIEWDACRLLAIDAVQREKDADKRARLREGFFHRATLGGGVACLVAATAFLGASQEARATQLESSLAKLSIYTLSRIRREVRRLARALAGGQPGRDRLGPARP